MHDLGKFDKVWICEFAGPFVELFRVPSVQAAHHYKNSLALRGNSHRANFNLAEILYKQVRWKYLQFSIFHFHSIWEGNTKGAKCHYQRG